LFLTGINTDFFLPQQEAFSHDQFQMSSSLGPFSLWLLFADRNNHNRLARLGKSLEETNSGWPRSQFYLILHLTQLNVNICNMLYLAF